MAPCFPTSQAGADVARVDDEGAQPAVLLRAGVNVNMNKFKNMSMNMSLTMSIITSMTTF